MIKVGWQYESDGQWFYGEDGLQDQSEENGFKTRDVFAIEDGEEVYFECGNAVVRLSGNDQVAVKKKDLRVLIDGIRNVMFNAKDDYSKGYLKSMLSHARGLLSTKKDESQ